MNRNLPQGPPAWYSKERRASTYRKMMALVVAIFIVGVGSTWWWSERFYDRLERSNQAKRDEARALMKAEISARRTVHVTDRYELSWPAKGGAPALKLSIPVVEMGAWRRYQHPTIENTLYGPAMLELVMPVTEMNRMPILEMYRERPGWATEERSKRGMPACEAEAEWRGRYVRVLIDDGRRDCAVDGEAKASIAAAVPVRLESLAFETQVPPSVDIELTRLRAIEAACERAIGAPSPGGLRLTHQADLLCGYTLALGDSLLQQAPRDAAELMVKGFAAWRVNQYNGRWDSYYLDDIVAALASAGETEGAVALAAHCLRASQRNDEKKSEIAQSKRDSLEAMLRLSEPLAADDPMQELVQRSLPEYLYTDKAERPRLIAVTLRWHEKAAALDPHSDLALRTRWAVCAQSIYVLERGAEIGRCADEFLALWQERVASGKDLGDLSRGMNEQSMAWYLQMMWNAYAFGTQDFRGARAGLARVRAQMEKRLPASLWTRLYADNKMIDETLAAKAAAR